jgi:hypothetical protein
MNYHDRLNHPIVLLMGGLRRLCPRFTGVMFLLGGIDV